MFGVGDLLLTGVIYLHKRGYLLQREKVTDDNDDNFLLGIFAVIGIAATVFGAVLSIIQVYLAFIFP